MTNHFVLFDEFAFSRADRLRDAAKLARAHAEECERRAEEAADIADEAEEVAVDLESAADDWEAVANGDLTFEEAFVHDERDRFSFD